VTIEEKKARIILSHLLPLKQSLKALSQYDSAEVVLRLLESQKKVCTQVDKNRVDDNVLKNCLVLGEPGYPELLAQISDPPLVLYYQGDVSLLSKLENSVALVGTRKATPYGTAVAEKFTREAADLGMSTVSGMALGIDTIVHNTSLKRGLPTVAVLGTGVLNPYPAANHGLYYKIVKSGGVVVSEYYSEEAYNKWVFPRRNRIIAGLAPVTIIVEAPEKSGALLTANLAHSYNRGVYAVPGSIFSTGSAGTCKLLKSLKAEPVSSLFDVFPLLSEKLQEQNASDVNSEEEIILSSYYGGLNMEHVAARLKWSPARLAAKLGQMQIDGILPTQ
jgi:DNA processing protein